LIVADKSLPALRILPSDVELRVAESYSRRSKPRSCSIAADRPMASGHWKSTPTIRRS